MCKSGGPLDYLWHCNGRSNFGPNTHWREIVVIPHGHHTIDVNCVLCQCCRCHNTFVCPIGLDRARRGIDFHLYSFTACCCNVSLLFLPRGLVIDVRFLLEEGPVLRVVSISGCRSLGQLPVGFRHGDCCVFCHVFRMQGVL